MGNGALYVPVRVIALCATALDALDTANIVEGVIIAVAQVNALHVEATPTAPYVRIAMADARPVRARAMFGNCLAVATVAAMTIVVAMTIPEGVGSAEAPGNVLMSAPMKISSSTVREAPFAGPVAAAAS